MRGVKTPCPVAKIDSALAPLLEKLLALGGHQTVLPQVEEDVEKILERGRVFRGDRKALLMKGRVSHCHENVAMLWDANRSLVDICTGYALSRDGIWRQHSWGRARLSGRIVETTERRIMYFGFILSQKEAVVFAQNNS